MDQHTVVLLKKDFITLKRNLGFILMFIALPIVMMGTFWKLQSLIEAKWSPEQHHMESKCVGHIKIRVCFCQNSLRCRLSGI